MKLQRAMVKRARAMRLPTGTRAKGSKSEAQAKLRLKNNRKEYHWKKLGTIKAQFCFQRVSSFRISTRGARNTRDFGCMLLYACPSACNVSRWYRQLSTSQS